MLPVTRANWVNIEKLFTDTPRLRRTEQRILRDNANWLIERCYEPNAEVGYRLTRKGDLPPEVYREPINWGDLHAFVELLGTDVWRVTLEEAAPGVCPALCAYIEGWLRKWGWENIIVETEW